MLTATRSTSTSPAAAPVSGAEPLPAKVAALATAATEPNRTQAWESFLERYSLLLLHTAFAMGGDYDRAMDRYLYMLDQLRRDDCRRLRRFEANGRSKFSTWLVVVAKRLCLDEYRHAYGRARASRPGAPPDEARTTRRRLADLTGEPIDLATLADNGRPDPFSALDRAENCRVLRAELLTLDPRDLELLRLRFEQELPAREIAQALGYPSAFQVYRRLNALLSTLRRRLTRAGVEADVA